jgi:hypothetical protein
MFAYGANYEVLIERSKPLYPMCYLCVVSQLICRRTLAYVLLMFYCVHWWIFNCVSFDILISF